MRYRILRALFGILLFLTATCASRVASADIYAELDSTTAVAGGVQFSYSLFASNRCIIHTGDYITLYDFHGYVAGSEFVPVDWEASVQPVGQTPPGVNPSALTGDRVGAVNITFTYRGAADLSGPLSPIAGYGAFGAVSIESTSGLGCCTSTVHKSNPGKADHYLPVPSIDYVVLPAQAMLQSVGVSQPTVAGGQKVAGTVTLSGAAPVGGASVSLSSSNTAVATVLAKVTVAEGDSTANFVISTKAVAAMTSVTIAATYRGVKKSVGLKVRPIGVASLVLNPATVTGGQNSLATITLEAPAGPSSILVTLTSSSTSATFVNGMGDPITSVVIPAGTKTVTVTVRTVAVSSTRNATLKATANTVGKSAVLTINP